MPVRALRFGEQEKQESPRQVKSHAARSMEFADYGAYGVILSVRFCVNMAIFIFTNDFLI